MRPSRLGQAVRALALLAAAAAAAYGAIDAWLARDAVVRGAGTLTVPLFTATGLALVASLLGLFDRVIPFVLGRRADVSRAPLSLLLLEIPFLGAVLHLVLMPQGHAVYVRVSAALAAGALATSALLYEPLHGLIPPRLRRAAHLLCLNAIACALCLEIGLRVLARAVPSALLVGAYTPAELVERTRMKAGELYLGFPTNSRGYYDAEPAPRAPRARLVVSIADSFSIGMVPHDRHFTTVCEREIPGLEVYNMGLPGLNPPEYLYLVDTETAPLRPDAVLVCLFVGNDLHEWCEATEYRGLWLGRRNLMIWVVPQRLWRLRAEASRATRKDGLAAAGRPRYATETALSGSAVADRFPWLDDPLTEPPTYSEERYDAIERRRALAICGPGPACFAALERLLLRMKEDAPAALSVVLIPDEFQVEDALWSRVGGPSELGPLERDRPQRLLSGMLSQLGIPALDLLPVLRAVPPLSDGNQHLYMRRDTHWNSRGNAVAGRAIAAFVRSQMSSAGNMSHTGQTP